MKKSTQINVYVNYSMAFILFFFYLILVACSKQTETNNADNKMPMASGVVVGGSAITGRNPVAEQARPNLAHVFRTSIATDINPDPNIVEINLEAKESTVEFSDGVISKVYAYNGVVPGPLIKAKKGDTLIVNFTNNLPESTTIHWHGLQLPADMDGASVAQNPIETGGTFQYKFVLPDAALFWYHPHVRSNVQVEKGLAGPLLVSDKEEALSLKLLTEHVLVLDDVLLDDLGEVQEPFAGTVADGLLEKINGREGNILLVNGEQQPTIKARVGIPLRWRIVNVANARFMKLSLDKHKFTRIGGDGGLLTQAIPNLNNIMMVPGERADIVVTPQGEPGEILQLMWNDEPRGKHTVTIENGAVVMDHDHSDGTRPPVPLLNIELVENSIEQQALALPEILNAVEPIDTTDAAVKTLAFGHSMPMPNGDIFFTINGKRFDEITSDDAPDANIGETQVWELVNMSMGDHPFHLHGFFFQVLDTVKKDENGNVVVEIPAPPLENKDTVNLPGRPGPIGSSTTLRIAIKFDPGHRNPDDILANGGIPAIVDADSAAGIKGHSGGWQFHCHILEHADGGMMSFMEIWQ